MDNERISLLRHDIQAALAAISAGANVLLSDSEMAKDDCSLIQAQLSHRLEWLNNLIQEVYSLPKQL